MFSHTLYPCATGLKRPARGTTTVAHFSKPSVREDLKRKQMKAEIADEVEQGESSFKDS